MYEWEQPVSANRKAIRCVELQAEIRRIANVTLSGDFRKPEDRKYWEDRLKKLNSELNEWEQSGR